MPIDKNIVNQIPNNQIYDAYKSEKERYKEFKNSRLHEYESDLSANNVQMIIHAIFTPICFYMMYFQLLEYYSMFVAISAIIPLPLGAFFGIIGLGLFIVACEIGFCLIQGGIYMCLNRDELMK